MQKSMAVSRSMSRSVSRNSHKTSSSSSTSSSSTSSSNTSKPSRQSSPGRRPAYSPHNRAKLGESRRPIVGRRRSHDSPRRGGNYDRGRANRDRHFREERLPRRDEERGRGRGGADGRYSMSPEGRARRGRSRSRSANRKEVVGRSFRESDRLRDRRPFGRDDFRGGERERERAWFEDRRRSSIGGNEAMDEVRCMYRQKGNADRRNDDVSGGNKGVENEMNIGGFREHDDRRGGTYSRDDTGAARWGSFPPPRILAVDGGGGAFSASYSATGGHNMKDFGGSVPPGEIVGRRFLDRDSGGRIAVARPQQFFPTDIFGGGLFGQTGGRGGDIVKDMGDASKMNIDNNPVVNNSNNVNDGNETLHCNGHPGTSQIDRSRVSPFLLRVFHKVNGVHSLSDFAVRGKEPVEDEVQIYTWTDAKLRELLDLIKDVCEEARERDAIWTFRLVYPDRSGRNVMTEIGTVHASRFNPHEDNKTLQSAKFQIGDYISLSIRLPRKIARETEETDEENERERARGRRSFVRGRGRR